MLEEALSLGKWSRILKQKRGAEEGDELPASKIVMTELPFKPSELDPVLSSSTVDAHQRIHKDYIDRTRELVQGTPYAEMSLREVVRRSGENEKDSDLFRNAAQAWNHAFYWLSISPPGQDTAPRGDLLDIIREKFGSIEACREKIIGVADESFGSGYVWVVQEEDTVSVLLTKDAMTPIAKGLKPLLCLDLWEHAYYLDYEGDRMSYVDSGVKELLNWGFADRNWENTDEW